LYVLNRVFLSLLGNDMADVSLSSIQLKEIVKEALLEVLQEQRGLFYELVTEALEDIALVRAIEEAKDSEPATRDEIMSLLS
jgi:hypothetical protein